MLNSEENLKRKGPIQMEKSKLNQIKQMDSKCHFTDLEHTFSYVENDGLNLVL